MISALVTDGLNVPNDLKGENSYSSHDEDSMHSGTLPPRDSPSAQSMQEGRSPQRESLEASEENMDTPTDSYGPVSWDHDTHDNRYPDSSSRESSFSSGHDTNSADQRAHIPKYAEGNGGMLHASIRQNKNPAYMPSGSRHEDDSMRPLNGKLGEGIRSDEPSYQHNTSNYPGSANNGALGAPQLYTHGGMKHNDGSSTPQVVTTNTHAAHVVRTNDRDAMLKELPLMGPGGPQRGTPASKGAEEGTLMGHGGAVTTPNITHGASISANGHQDPWRHPTQGVVPMHEKEGPPRDGPQSLAPRSAHSHTNQPADVRMVEDSGTERDELYCPQRYTDNHSRDSDSYTDEEEDASYEYYEELYEEEVEEDEEDEEEPRIDIIVGKGHGRTLNDILYGTPKAGCNPNGDYQADIDEMEEESYRRHRPTRKGDDSEGRGPRPYTPERFRGEEGDRKREGISSREGGMKKYGEPFTEGTQSKPGRHHRRHGAVDSIASTDHEPVTSRQRPARRHHSGDSDDEYLYSSASVSICPTQSSRHRSHKTGSGKAQPHKTAKRQRSSRKRGYIRDDRVSDEESTDENLEVTISKAKLQSKRAYPSSSSRGEPLAVADATAIAKTSIERASTTPDPVARTSMIVVEEPLTVALHRNGHESHKNEAGSLRNGVSTTASITQEVVGSAPPSILPITPVFSATEDKPLWTWDKVKQRKRTPFSGFLCFKSKTSGLAVKNPSNTTTAARTEEVKSTGGNAENTSVALREAVQPEGQEQVGTVACVVPSHAPSCYESTEGALVTQDAVLLPSRQPRREDRNTLSGIVYTPSTAHSVVENASPLIKTDTHSKQVEVPLALPDLMQPTPLQLIDRQTAMESDAASPLPRSSKHAKRRIEPVSDEDCNSSQRRQRHMKHGREKHHHAGGRQRTGALAEDTRNTRKLFPSEGRTVEHEGSEHTSRRRKMRKAAHRLESEDGYGHHSSENHKPRRKHPSGGGALKESHRRGSQHRVSDSD